MVAMVQRGTAGRGACISSWHSMHDESVGKITRAWPLNPIPPSVCVRIILAREVHTFRTTINQWLQTFGILGIEHANERRIDPSSSFDAVKTADNDLELHVVIFILILDFAHVRSNLNALHSFLHKCCSDLSFRFSYVRLTE